MSRKLALLPFEVSRRAPEPPLTDEELGLAEEELAFAEGELPPGGAEGLEEERREDEVPEEERRDGEVLDGEPAGEGASDGFEDAPAGGDAEAAAAAQAPAGEGNAAEDPTARGGGLGDDSQDFEGSEASEFSESPERAEAGDGSAEGAGGEDASLPFLDQAGGQFAGDGESGSEGGSGAEGEAPREGEELIEGEGELGGGEFPDDGEFPDSSGFPDGGEPDALEAPEELEDAEHAWLARADRVALARWVRGELARLLASSGALAPVLLELDEDAEAEAEELDDLELGLEAGPAAAAAGLAQSELALSCRLRADAEAVEVLGLLGDAAGEERVRFGVSCALGEAAGLPARLARELLLALGEDAAVAALPEADEGAVEPEAVLDLVRGARSLEEAREARGRLDAAGVVGPSPSAEGRAASSTDGPASSEGPPPTAAEPQGPGSPGGATAAAPPARADDLALADPTPGLLQLLDALALAPGLRAARELILRSAEAAASGPAMPAHLAALERLAELLPGDPDALCGLAAYRRLHFDPDGARDLLLRARDLAPGGDAEAAVLGQLASLAESEGRLEAALQHLREATRIADDAGLYLHLGLLLRAREPLESTRAFQRAVVLAPEQPRPRLELARNLAAAGETGRAATEAARAMQLARGVPELAQAATELLAGLLATPS